MKTKLFALLVVIIFLMALPHTNLLNTVENTLSQNTVLQKADSKETPTQKIPAKKDHSAQKTKLLEELNTTLSVNNQFAISVYDINHKESFGINETKSFHSASVTKVLVATTALEDVEKGKYTLDQFASGYGYTFKWHLEQMINQSNNNSWDYFNNLLGFKREQEEADKLKLTGVDMFKTHMTTKGVTELLTQLYKGNVLTTEHRDLLFSYMQNTETENRISPAIPKGTRFYHKTGTFNGEIHDAAIVIHPKNPFVVTIFTDDLTGITWETRFKSFQQATTALYEYFSEI